MKVYSIHRRQQLPISKERAWTFFANPSNLEVITPPWLQFQIESPVDQKMYAGMIIQYRIKAIAGFPMRWTTEITHMKNQEYFVDEQRFGPYRFWHHQHHFRSTGEGVEVEDLVHYALPASILGRFVHWLTIKKRLENIFDFRQQWLYNNATSNI